MGFTILYPAYVNVGETRVKFPVFVSSWSTPGRPRRGWAVFEVDFLLLGGGRGGIVIGGMRCNHWNKWYRVMDDTCLLGLL